MKYRLTVVLAALLSSLTLPAVAATPKPAAAAPAGGTTLATVNGKAIPASRADAVIRNQQQQGRQVDDNMRAVVKEELIRREVVAQEAQKKGLDKNPEFQTELDMMRQEMLVRAYVLDFIKTNQVSEEQIKQEYEAQRAQAGNKEYKVRHILVKTEERAKELIGKLQAGAKFEDLAKESEDQGSKDKGGDLDWLLPTGLPKPLADVVTKLEKGKFTATPVQSQMGYHIFRVDDVRDWKAPTLDEKKGQLHQFLQQQALEKRVAELRKAAKVQ